MDPLFFALIYNLYTSAVWSPYRNPHMPWAILDDEYANGFWRR